MSELVKVKRVIKDCDSEYVKLAGELLGIEELAYAPMPTITLENVDNAPRGNVEDLVDKDDQLLAAKVCELTEGMTALRWNDLNED